jgi:AraC-like DNA-binding protein
MHFDLLPRDVDLFFALNLPYYIDVEKGSTLHNLFEEYSLLAGSNVFSDKLRVKALLLSMLAEYIRLATTAEIWVANTENKRGQQLLCYIQEHMHQNLSNAVMADFLHMEVRSFIRFFKKLTGYTPAKYVTLRRMELAKTLLEESELPILDIMYRVGMQDISYFSKLFKQHYSLSPRNYREMLNRAW